MTDSNGTIAPKAFLRTADLIQEVTTKFVAACNDDDGMLVIDFDES